ncbi:MAG: 1-deoxy-D-xylulose-5-phosphate reductoisomerase [Ruminococcaceae bacterium]|nr:1-deoxy-D-xylulose-5-phosphate reductoisomerase [Oscillospiraceae bacterium]
MNINNNQTKINSVVIIGSTGSVGTQTVDVVKQLGLQVELLTGWRNIPLLAQQTEELHPKMVYVPGEEQGRLLKDSVSGPCPEIITSEKDLLQAVKYTQADCILHSIAGLAGIPTALAAAESGKRLAIANKEAIIALGDEIKKRLAKSGGEMIPVDSEHSAIFQCLSGNRQCSIKRILLTASGGPFFGCKKEDLKEVTVEKALAHPTWKMGPKITVDSATLMNKGFEIMEAVRLFDVTEAEVEVLIHRQSIIHSMVEYTDNTVIAQLGAPDMRSCIRYALTYPNRAELTEPGLNFSALANLTFASPDTETFSLLNTAREAIRLDGVYPAALIAADESAVEAFLNHRLPFCEIPAAVEAILAGTKLSDYGEKDEEAIKEAVRLTTETAERILPRYKI